MVPLGTYARLELGLSRWKKALIPKIVGNNEVLTHGSAIIHVLKDLDS